MLIRKYATNRPEYEKQQSKLPLKKQCFVGTEREGVNTSAGLGHCTEGGGHGGRKGRWSLFLGRKGGEGGVGGTEGTAARVCGGFGGSGGFGGATASGAPLARERGSGIIFHFVFLLTFILAFV